MSVLEKLSAHLCDSLPWLMSSTKSIVRPDFSNAGKVHDWRNHVPEIIKENWPELSDDAKLCAVIMASNQADAEVWD